MGRGKVKLRLIENGSSRKYMYRKRLAGLKKKAYELSKLCDVPSLLISFDSDGKVETFPENKDEACAILEKYNSVSNKAGEKYKQNSESTIQSQILKKQLELNRLRIENEDMITATVKFLDSMLMEVQGRILLQSCMHDFAFEKEVENGVDAGKLNGDKECEELEMATEEYASCNGHDDLPDFSGVEELLRWFEASLDDTNNMQMATEDAGCHEQNDELVVEDFFKGSDSAGGDMNDPQIVTNLAAEDPAQSTVFSCDHPNLTGVEELLRRFEGLSDDMSLFKGSDSSGGDMNAQVVTHLAAEESDQSNVFSGNYNGYSEHVPNSMCCANDDLPYLFELSDFIEF